MAVRVRLQHAPTSLLLVRTMRPLLPTPADALTAHGPARSLCHGAALGLLLVGAACHPGAAGTPSSVDSTQVRRDVEYLASDRLEGRGSGTAGHDSAAAYVARQFRGLRLDSVGLAGYRQPFEFRAPTDPADPHAAPDTIRTANVVALLRGSDPLRRDEYVVIGAHLDHLGRSAVGALDADAAGAIRNGADDNASGSAAVLELARRLARRPPGRSVVFALFSGEERGLIGSSRFVERPLVPLERTSAMLNFDMVGRLRDSRLIVYGVETATEMRAIVDSANTGGLTIRGVGDGYGPSDHSSFYGKGIPVLHFFTDLHDDYHRATDDADKVSADGIVRVVDLAERIARDVANRPARLTVRQTAAPARAGGETANLPYLGSIPDMGADVKGMRLTGVRAGSPADRGGLRAGDVIVRFGGVDVTDIYSYTRAMQARKAGDVVQVEVLREGRPVTLAITLGTRP